MRSLIILTSLCLVFLYAHFKKRQIEGFFQVSTETTQLLPNFKFTSFVTGKNVTPDLLEKNKTLLIHFWATWCAPCEKELPDLVEFAHKNKATIQVLLVAVNDKPEKVKSFIQKFPKLQAAFYLDNAEVTSRKFGTLKLPETYLYNSKGQLIRKLIGAQDWKNSFFQRLISSKSPS